MGEDVKEYHSIWNYYRRSNELYVSVCTNIRLPIFHHRKMTNLELENE